MPVGEALSQFPRERTWLLPALQAPQRAEGWLSPETLAAGAAHVRVPAREVWGVASHYPELRLAKPGRRVVRVCTGVACVARGGERLLERCERRLGIRAGETTPDGALTPEAMDCAFAGAVAPVVEAHHADRRPATHAVLHALLDAPAAHRIPPPLTGPGRPPTWRGATSPPGPSGWRRSAACSPSAAASPIPTTSPTRSATGPTARLRACWRRGGRRR